MRKYAVALILVVAAAGCSQLDFGLASSEPEWGSTPASDAAPSSTQSQQTLDQVLAAWDAQARPAEGDYLIGPGDELEVDVFALEQPGQTSSLDRTVSSDGNITLPWVQSVKVQGLTVPGAERAIKAAYDGRYIKDPQVTVNVSEYASSTVVVTGAVNRPGIYPLKHNEATLLECLSLAGGPTREAGDELTLVRPQRGKGADEARPDSIRINLLDLLGGGKPLLNVPVGGGDVITIAPRTDEYIYVMGYVRRPGAFKLTNLRRVDAVSAVALAGGLANTARAANSFLIRRNSDRQHAIPVNLDKVARGDVQPLYLNAGDTLVVGTGFGGRVAEVLAPSMGASVSASASVAP